MPGTGDTGDTACGTGQHVGTHAQADTSLAGEWVGAFELGRGWRPISAARFERDGGAYRGTLAAVDVEWQGALPLERIAVQGARVRFELPRPSGRLVFDGRAENCAIVGDVAA